MKSVTLLTTLMLGLCASAQATIYPFAGGTPEGGVIQDNYTAWSDMINVSAVPGTIASVEVHLNITGGYNGDLYAYLSYNGTLMPLLNRVGVSATELTGFGFATSGMNVTLADGAAYNIHNVETPGVGTYAADGRNIDPLSSPATFDSTIPTTFGATFGGMNPNGEWTLVFADASGGNQSTIASWSLDIITAVPEPINVALGVFGGLFLVGSVCRSERVRKLFGKAAPVPVED